MNYVFIIVEFNCGCIHFPHHRQMLPTFSLFFLLFGLQGVVGRCPPLEKPRHGVVACFLERRRISCSSNLPVGAVAEFSCQEFYTLSSGEEGLLKCGSNGNWSAALPKCISDCGKRRNMVSLIVKGTVADHGSFPWHVAIYYILDGNYEYWCGGSLISETAVLTAAHCVWEIPPQQLILAFGKFHRKYDITEKSSQIRRVKKIELLSSYQDVTGNYNGDLAVIFLQEPVKFGDYCAPVCIDWEERLVDEQLAEGSFGVVLGWGLTENDTLGDHLRVVSLPVVSDAKCITEEADDFKKFVTYTSFCAGSRNGSGVCNGDSGGGLTFFHETSERWYLQGVVSVSPRKKGTSFCDVNFYTIFTRVGAFSRWLKAVEKSEYSEPPALQNSNTTMQLPKST